MEKVNLPILEYKELNFQKHTNVSFENRSEEFEEQNRLYQTVGYTEHNSVYFQTFEVGKDVLDFAHSLFPRFSVSIMKQLPGQTLPEHDDTFFQFSKKFKVDSKDCMRLNIFLEDWQSGHYFEINNTPVLQWRAGDAILIDKGEKHLSGNMGMTPKYTMQITGVRSEFKRR